jgi:hypothetical protein
MDKMIDFSHFLVENVSHLGIYHLKAFDALFMLFLEFEGL